MQELLDARRPPATDPDLAAHAAECQACRDMLSACGAAIEAVAAHLPAAPVGLADRVAADWRDLRAQPARTGWYRGLRATAVVVAATAAAVVLALVLKPERPNRSPTVAVDSADSATDRTHPSVGAAGVVGAAAPATQAGAAPPVRSLGVLTRQAASGYVELGRNSQQVVSEALLALPGFGPAVGQPPNAEQQSPAQPADPANQVADTRAPLAESAADAMSFLWETLPGSCQPAQ
jgi:hypothetical protein